MKRCPLLHYKGYHSANTNVAGRKVGFHTYSSNLECACTGVPGNITMVPQWKLLDGSNMGFKLATDCIQSNVFACKAIMMISPYIYSYYIIWRSSSHCNWTCKHCWRSSQTCNLLQTIIVGKMNSMEILMLTRALTQDIGFDGPATARAAGALDQLANISNSCFSC